MNKTLLLNARRQASAWASDLLKRDPDTWALLDTETTGLDVQAEVIQIGVIDGGGATLMDNVLVKPTVPNSPEALAVHHITDAMLHFAPLFPEVLPRLREVMKGKLLVSYNAEFDLRLLLQSGRAHHMELQLGIEGWACAMWQYARWFGDWNEESLAFRRQKLPGGDHSAVGDCRATLEIIHQMADTCTV